MESPWTQPQFQRKHIDMLDEECKDNHEKTYKGLDATVGQFVDCLKKNCISVAEKCLG